MSRFLLPCIPQAHSRRIHFRPTDEDDEDKAGVANMKSVNDGSPVMQEV